ncbi:MAG: M20/M25/M40 family metallo-hydrolase [Elusimicrobia bacterium]|nr:M20/M25/M40 family metallo-hydrolase [Elusimicrobiota bacterium]
MIRLILTGPAVVLTVAAAKAAGDSDLNRAGSARAAIAAAAQTPVPAPGTNASADDVWVSFDRRDLARPQAASFPLSSPIMADSRTSVFKVGPDMLPVLSQFMHDHFGRCAGFFASRTRKAAEASMTTAKAKAASGPYTLDQQAVAAPLVARVSEANMRDTITSLAAYNNRYYTADTGVEAAHWLQARWQKIADRIPGAATSLVTHEGWPQPSVVLTIPGSETPDQIVVLGGHLDSINGWGGDTARAPGADDNASGIAVLTEAARILADGGYRPKRTIQFMGYAAEEVGLRGSQDIAEQYAAAGKKVVGVIQYDMSNFKGSSDEIYLLTDNVDDVLSAFVGRLIDVYVGVKRSTTECGYACSDHASWNAQGYPAAMAFEASFDGMNHKIHTDQDTLANSGGNATHSVSFAKLAVAFAVELSKSSGGLRVSGAAAPRR